MMQQIQNVKTKPYGKGTYIYNIEGSYLKNVSMDVNGTMKTI